MFDLCFMVYCFLYTLFKYNQINCSFIDSYLVKRDHERLSQKETTELST